MDCIACSGEPVATLIDGAHHKPGSEVHERLYREKGYRIYRRDAQGVRIYTH